MKTISKNTKETLKTVALTATLVAIAAFIAGVHYESNVLHTKVLVQVSKVQQ